MSFTPSIALLLSGLFVAQSLAQNGTFVPANTTETINNATEFAFPGQNMTTLQIEYQPPPMYFNGSIPYNVTYPVVTERISYYPLEGLAIVDGDIIFGTEAELLAHVAPATGKRDGNNPPLERRALSFSRDDPRKWPGGVVEYYWENDATRAARETLFLEAVKIWTDRLPFLHFSDMGVQSTTTLNGPIILKLSDKTVSSSPLGRATSAGSNYMVLGKTSNVGVYVHEIGHTLGLKHEHQRPDYYYYMHVDCTKVCGEFVYKPAPNANQIDHCTDADCSSTACKGHGCNFKPVPDDKPEWDWSGPYDVLSIMQYGSSLFARPETGWADPVTVTDPRVPLRKGNGVVPTLTDLQRVCALYYERCRGICGDGILSLGAGETCDDGNNVSGDGCESNCQHSAQVCGNGILEGTEQCDDNNTVDGDGCSSTCQKEYCGDGIVQTALGEECDGGPGCTASCTKECLAECNPDPRFNKCHITTSCITIEGGTAASAGRHYCACAHGFRANGPSPGDVVAQMRLPWASQQGRVFVQPGLECNILCDHHTLGKDGCEEVVQRDVCY